MNLKNPIFVPMKKALLTLSSVFAVLAFCLPAGAQDGSVELQAFQEAVGDHSILFRGQQAARYNFLANGHPYWSRPEFEQGDLVFENNLYRNVPLNIDAMQQRVLVKLSESPFAVALVPELTPSFTIGDRKFVGLGPGEALSEGIYEVFGEGRERVYKHISKQVNFSISNVNGKAIGYIDENYRSDVYRFFAYFESYYFRDADGRFTRIKNRNALIRQFPERKQEIRKAIRTGRLNDRDVTFDDFCKAVLNITAR